MESRQNQVTLGVQSWFKKQPLLSFSISHHLPFGFSPFLQHEALTRTAKQLPQIYNPN